MVGIIYMNEDLRVLPTWIAPTFLITGLTEILFGTWESVDGGWTRMSGPQSKTRKRCSH